MMTHDEWKQKKAKLCVKKKKGIWTFYIHIKNFCSVSINFHHNIRRKLVLHQKTPLVDIGCATNHRYDPQNCIARKKLHNNRFNTVKALVASSNTFNLTWQDIFNQPTNPPFVFNEAEVDRNINRFISFTSVPRDPSQALDWLCPGRVAEFLAKQAAPG